MIYIAHDEGITKRTYRNAVLHSKNSFAVLNFAQVPGILFTRSRLHGFVVLELEREKVNTTKGIAGESESW
jgi:hypothetical protein